MPQEIKFIIKYSGGSAEQSYLDLYDAATSMHGLAKVLSITSHALLNGGQVKHKGNSTKDVSFLLHPPKQGSFIEVVTIVFDDPAFKAIGSSVLVAVFWDFVRYTWQEATGRTGKIVESRTKKIIDENEDFISEMIGALEIPLQQLHRPILNDPEIEIQIARPKVGTVVKFDADSLDYVMSQDDPIFQKDVRGNVTKYNNISGIGRFYDDVLDRTVPFHSDSLDDAEKKVLSWSLHNSNGDYSAGKISIDVDVIKSNSGHVKRYLIKDARE